MPTDRILIVGASQAGVQIAASMRTYGSTSPITLVGAETHLPYQRPPLSKAFLSGKSGADSLQLRAAAFYAENDIDVVTGERINDLRFDGSSGTATSITGRTFAFDKLALAVGGAPRRLHLAGAELANLLYLRDLDDATLLRDSLDEAQHVVVIGGGFVGLEAAAVARSLGKQVVVVEAQERLLARAVAPEISAFFIDAHRRRGVEIRLNSTVSGFTGQGRVRTVELADGSSLPADVVLVGIGLVANTDLGQQLGLEIAGGGIVIDERAQTSRAGIVAAGDCATLRTGHELVRIESVANAVDQGRVAAATLAGIDDPLANVPWFWSHQGDIQLQIAGLSAGYDRVVVRGEPASEHFSVIYYRADVFIAIDSINAPRDYMAGRKILQTGGSLPSHAAGDLETDLKSFVLR